MQAFHWEFEAPGPSPSDGMKTSVPEKFASTVGAAARVRTAAARIERTNGGVDTFNLLRFSGYRGVVAPESFGLSPNIGRARMRRKVRNRGGLGRGSGREDLEYPFPCGV
jgi:hypothetical protein